ncbi:MAG: serine--tRNA ligase [Candidatus Eremiobacteraeota bacterium]|nr:serine--tRNA ligase [Candidatus Eremiobacteraeota bacterium]MBV8366021.1 serine--tRNA ligase [Candidatus Eremiobacteraeota bacterium]
MLDRRLIREQPDRVRRSLARRQLPVSIVDDILALDADWRTAVTAADAAKSERNQISSEFAKAKGQPPETLARLRERSNELGERIASYESSAASLEQRLDELLAQVPNVLADDVPDGADSNANVLVRSSGDPPAFAFEAKPHWEIGERLGILDFERGVRLARSRFTVIEGAGARLNRALINFFLERNTAAGFTEIAPPLLVNRESVEATGHLSKFSDAMFAVDDGSLFLSPTSEVQLVNLHRDEILEAADLPKRYTAYTACFRQEAGAAGKDTRGLIRQHQFEKVELVALTRPDAAAAMHDQLVRHAESLLQALELPYRLMLLCSGDTGFASQKTYDLEVWLPGQNTYREISSLSNTGDFQARRAGVRFRPAPKAKPEFVHALNGSALAIGRTLLAVLENYQEADGSVRVPRILQPYMGGTERIA